ncbi:helix-turn-helix domain-containing protein [Salinimonas sediminis]|uniref:Helix-turn-helix domain-containing protein n=1 Tax=Salinimonas sediminis TaxID=2303538 RepID=A0A346NIV4_9ALTE|nr:helix-turn-helix domain-containing protein [Salinimonas sediminis]
MVYIHGANCHVAHIMDALCRASIRVFSGNLLQRAGRGDDNAGHEHTLVSHINRLRVKLKGARQPTR